MMARIGRFGGSLTAQVMMLVLGAIVVAQAVTILAVYLAPPRPPTTFSYLQIAAALKGEALASDQGRSLRRTVSPTAPAQLAANGQSDAATRLAAALGAQRQDVRVRRLGPPPFVMLTTGRRPMDGPPGPRPPGGGPQGGGPPGGFGPGGFGPAPMGPGPTGSGPTGSRPSGSGPMGPRPGEPPWFGPFGRDEQWLRGEFIAGWRQADGGWVVVRPSAELEWLRRIAIWVGGGLLVMGPIGFWFSRRISAPLARFAASADTLGRDPTAAPLRLSGPAEIGVAARAFNAMQGRLQRYVSDRVGMVGAISHDLRTPLTRIRFKLEMADPATRDAVLSDVVKMEQMINAVIAFSRDSAAAGLRQPLDLTSLIACVVDEAAAAGGDAEAEFSAPVIVDGDPVALQRLFDNLIGNALKYGTCARVSITESAGWEPGDEVVVSVRDRGPGLPQRELEKVFTPFYRTEAAQQRTDSGVGLGLSIARAVARAHGGDVRLHSSAEGLLAEVILPRARAPQAGARP